jgi:hypothetical protein
MRIQIMKIAAWQWLHAYFLFSFGTYNLMGAELELISSTGIDNCALQNYERGKLKLFCLKAV